MKRLCPCCGLPARNVGLIIGASSDDRQVHGLVGICTRCTAAEAKLPKSTKWKRMNRSLDRALANPTKFLCKTFPDIGATHLAEAMLRHPEYGKALLVCLGWWDAGTGPAGLTRSDDQGTG